LHLQVWIFLFSQLPNMGLEFHYSTIGRRTQRVAKHAYTHEQSGTQARDPLVQPVQDRTHFRCSKMYW
jgi:hypothetical protein